MDHKASNSKKNRKWGRNEEKCAGYAKAQKREKHKLARVLQSSGEAAAMAYAEQNGLLGYLRGLKDRG